MDWSKGFSAKYFLSVVDPVTWRDIEHLDLTGGSINKTDSGLRESADINCNDLDISKERWIRIWLNATQNNNSERIALFTGITSSPKTKINYRRLETPLECYSVLKPADDVLLPRGYYVPVDIEGALVIKRLLSVSPAPIEISDGSPKLAQAIIAEDGETNLTMVDKILYAINWRLRLAGNGTIIVEPYPTDAATIIGTSYDIVEPEIEIEQDWFSCPNVFRAVSNEISAVARDESDESSLSIQNRGREIWAEESSCQLGDNETLAEYAMRRLQELQSYDVTISYSRRYLPDVYPGDIITLNYPAFEEMSMVNYVISSQSITLGNGTQVSETVFKENRSEAESRKANYVYLLDENNNYLRDENDNVLMAKV